LGASNVIPDGVGKGVVTVSSPGVLDLSGYSDTINGLTGDGSVILRPKLSLAGNAAAAFFDDGNRRLSASATLTQAIANNYSAGLYGRLMGYKQDGFGYFTPDLFYVTEARGTYWRTMGWWNIRLAGGLGIQQAGSDASAQFEYNFRHAWLGGGAINDAHCSALTAAR
jgi:hypothetical protein